MKRIALLIFIIFLTGCSKGGDDKRVEILHGMPTLWKSELVIADADMPDLKSMVVMFDSYDGSLAEHWSKDKFTEDYIPESVMAFTTETYRDKPRTVTIQLGDIVSVLDCKENNTGKKVCLVRTKHNTYAWLYAFHILDENGERMGNHR